MTTPVKILVANRGEIAIRIIRAIQELNHEAVAIYETPDQHSKHIRIANEAVWIGDGPRSDYLNIEKRLEKVEADIKKIKSRELAEELELLKKLQKLTEAGKPLRECVFNQKENTLMRGFKFLSHKPLLKSIGSVLVVSGSILPKSICSSVSWFSTSNHILLTLGSVHCSHKNVTGEVTVESGVGKLGIDSWVGWGIDNSVSGIPYQIVV